MQVAMFPSSRFAHPVVVGGFDRLTVSHYIDKARQEALRKGMVGDPFGSLFVGHFGGLVEKNEPGATLKVVGLCEDDSFPDVAERARPVTMGHFLDVAVEYHGNKGRILARVCDAQGVPILVWLRWTPRHGVVSHGPGTIHARDMEETVGNDAILVTR